VDELNKWTSKQDACVRKDNRLAKENE